MPRRGAELFSVEETEENGLCVGVRGTYICLQTARLSVEASGGEKVIFQITSPPLLLLVFSDALRWGIC